MLSSTPEQRNPGSSAGVEDDALEIRTSVLTGLVESGKINLKIYRRFKSFQGKPNLYVSV